MFYYPNVLQRHSGCFSTIWLAATTGNRVTRRELLKVNVKRTCNEILDYVTAKVPPLQPNQPRPRFSLYLSSQLQYGVVVVYHRQCNFFLGEVQQTIDRLIRTKKCIQIDMPESDRMVVDLPDCLNLMEEDERPQDPFFGVMESHKLPSPYKIHQMEFVVSDSLVSSDSPHTTLYKEGLSSPPPAITLKEQEQFVINTAECYEGADLPEVTAREIDLLMDQPDQFRGEVDAEKTGNRTRDQGQISSVNPLKETMLGTGQDSEWLQVEELDQPMELPLKAVAVEMTPPHVAMPTESVGDGPGGSLCEEVVVPPPPRHRGGRRRQLVFADPEVQISDREMQQHTGNPKTETRNLLEALLNLPLLTKYSSPAQLFSAPCGFLHPDLLLLWKQQASLAVLPNSGEMHGAEGESEQDMEVLRTEWKRRHSRMKEVTQTSSEFGLQPSEGPSDVDMMMDMSKDDRSGSDVIAPVSRWSPQEDNQPLIEPIAEENIEMPEAPSDIESRNTHSWITSTQVFEEATFDSVLPPEANRSTAAQILYKLLELLSAKQLSVYQVEPYSDIIIKPAALRSAD